MFHWDLALIVGFLATVVPWMGRRRIQQLMRVPETNTVERLVLYASTMAFQWVIAAVILWRITARRIPPSRFGLALPHPALTGIVGLGLTAVILVNQLISLHRIEAAPVDKNNMVTQLALKVFPQDAVERLAFFGLVVTVAFCEEWIYRGLVQGVFREWGKSAIAGIVGSAALFACAHLYQGRRGLVSTFVVGIVFSAARFWTGSLIPSVVAHFIADLTVGYRAPALVRTALAAQSGSQASAPSGDDSANILQL